MKLGVMAPRLALGLKSRACGCTPGQQLGPFHSKTHPLRDDFSPGRDATKAEWGWLGWVEGFSYGKILKHTAWCP
jgi:hypothetical protein